MSSYNKDTDSPDDDGSDVDLPLEELDPLRSTARPNNRSGENVTQDDQTLPWRNLGASRYGGLGQNVRSNLRRGKARRHGSEEDLQDLLDPQNGQNSSPSLNNSNDDAPLLQANGHYPGSKYEAERNLPQKGVSGFFKRFRSPPKEEVEDVHDPALDRHIFVGQPCRFPPNAVSNAKYTAWSFLPRTLYNEFSFFFNLYFLLVALSQLIPQLRIGYLSTYFAPLVFVLAITLGKEAYDDITRRRRDAELNSERYNILAFDNGAKGSSKKFKKEDKNRKQSRRKGSFNRLNDIDDEEAHLGNGSADPSDPVGVQEKSKQSKDLKVGDVLILNKDQRVPADVVVLQSRSADAESQGDRLEGEAFIRTDQLDGETDWKLRIAPALSQPMKFEELANLQITASKPDKKVTEFIGTLTWRKDETQDTTPEDVKRLGDNTSIPLTIDNTAWANTVLASNATVYAAVVYTGSQTRQALSTSPSRSKTGILEYEINNLTKILCALTLLLSFILVALEGFQSPDGHKWYIAVMRFLILFSTIIPISLRVNLDLGKSVYAWFIQRDRDIAGTVVRTSTIPEDLGRVEYLLSDKTGTLTQNDMQLRKIHIGTVSYANEAMLEVSSYIHQGFGMGSGVNSEGASQSTSATTTRSRREIGSRVRDVVIALAVCHNVTPTTSEEDGEVTSAYQASSPDEIAIVHWTASIGLRLAHRDRHSMVLESTHSGEVVARVQILNLFPFTSDGKRMGIIVKFTQDKEYSDSPVWFFQKGADTVMSSIVASNDWLDEETANMAREGLRTLVVGRKRLTMQQYDSFISDYRQASLSLHGRDESMARIVKSHLEGGLELLGVTGVEDKLQQDVKPSLELLRNAGIKIWMLTGDKVETARCVAVSSKLVSRGQYVHVIEKATNPAVAASALTLLTTSPHSALLIDGPSLSTLLTHHPTHFITTILPLPSIIACRCSPTQKASLASLLRAHTPSTARIAAIGDGGNDVSMIQTADVGLGLLGKEGRQASLAADFSLHQFSSVTKLLLWHGRNSYKRSAKLAQFVMHRGLVISACQTVFSIASRFEPKALYRDWLLVGYATVYTMAPVFSLVLDTDVPPHLARLYPELYRELGRARSLSYKTFFAWVGVSLYQGVAIQLLAQALAGVAAQDETQEDTDGGFSPGGPAPRMVALSFTALVLNELLMVCLSVTVWHRLMVATILGTLAVYLASVPGLGGYFDLRFVASWGFVWRVVVVEAVAVGPVAVGRWVGRWVRPPSWVKVRQGG